MISICDGQIYFDTSLYLKGQKPEVNVGLSVSRVGSAAQIKAMKKTASTLKLELAQFTELEQFVEFIEEVDEDTKKSLKRGERIREILKQEKLKPLPIEKEIVSIYASTKGFLDNVRIEDVKKIENELYEVIEFKKPDIFKSIREKKELDDTTQAALDKILEDVTKKYEVEGSKK